MSTTLVSPQNNENAEYTVKEKTVFQTQKSTERKTLKTLQIGSNGQLIGLENKKKAVPKKIAASTKPVKVFLDTKKTWLEIGTQTVKAGVTECEVQTDISGAALSDVHNDSGVGAGDIDQEAYDLMVKEPIPERYWRDLAEERRCSLAEALSENEMLHQSMEEMREENHNLSLLAGQAEYLASVLNDVLGDDNKTDETKVDDTKKSEEEQPENNDQESENNVETESEPKGEKEPNQRVEEKEEQKFEQKEEKDKQPQELTEK